MTTIGIQSIPGIYIISEARYHADPCPQPSLSASIATKLLDRSPLHAWTAHPRLNPNFERSLEARFDLGHAAHQRIVGGENSVQVVKADSWRSKEAKEQRNAIWEAGRVPILEADFVEIELMAEACARQLLCYQVGAGLFDPQKGQPEQTIVWQEPNGIWCRARPDWTPLFPREDLLSLYPRENLLGWDGSPLPYALTDYKTTSGSAHPDMLSRRLFDTGADIQAAFYLRGFKAVGGRDAEFRFVCQETEAPYALSIIELSPSALEWARRRVDIAIATWGECLRTGEWPGYPARVATIETPPWVESRWEMAQYVSVAPTPAQVTAALRAQAPLEPQP